MKVSCSIEEKTGGKCESEGLADVLEIKDPKRWTSFKKNGERME
jgi:hypothetical protein